MRQATISNFRRLDFLLHHRQRRLQNATLAWKDLAKICMDRRRTADNPLPGCLTQGM